MYFCCIDHPGCQHPGRCYIFTFNACPFKMLSPQGYTPREACLGHLCCVFLWCYVTPSQAVCLTLPAGPSGTDCDLSEFPQCMSQRGHAAAGICVPPRCVSDLYSPTQPKRPQPLLYPLSQIMLRARQSQIRMK